jgi:hypothetical protein
MKVWTLRCGLVFPPTGTVVARLLGTHGRALYAAPAYLRQHGTPRTPDDLDRHTLIANTAAQSHNRWDFHGRWQACEPRHLGAPARQQQQRRGVPCAGRCRHCTH